MNANLVELTARLLETGGLRHTPAGLPSLQLRLAHRGPQTEAGRPRQVECEVEGQVFGELATRMATLDAGVELACKGFLDRKSARNPQLVLHVTEYEID